MSLTQGHLQVPSWMEGIYQWNGWHTAVMRPSENFHVNERKFRTVVLNNIDKDHLATNESGMRTWNQKENISYAKCNPFWLENFQHFRIRAYNYLGYLETSRVQKIINI